MIKTCNICKQPKDETEFWEQKANRDGRENSCKQCRMSLRYERRRAKRIANGLKVKFPTIASRQLLAEDMKFCPRCKQVLPIVEFSTMKVRSGVASHCRNCSNQIAKELNSKPETKEARHQQYKRNREKTIDNNLQRKFGISYLRYKEMLAEQNGVCAICGKTPEANKKMLAVDHDHNTAKNRGLLCASCNICIGFIEKNRLDFSRLIAYHQQHNINGQIP